MYNALDEREVARIPTGEAFRQRFGNPCAVIHRVDVHLSLLEGAQETGRVEFLTRARFERVEQDESGVTVPCSSGQSRHGRTLFGADYGKSLVRAQCVGEAPRVAERVAYRAVVDKQDFPENLRSNAASIWVGPNCHLVHYPLRGGEQCNVVFTFHGRGQGKWGGTEGRKEEVPSYFQGICPKARQLTELPRTWKCWATADREPIGNCAFGRASLLGDAAHPTTQYMAQGACMAVKDVVTLSEALQVHGEWVPAHRHTPHATHRARCPSSSRAKAHTPRWTARSAW